VRSVLLHFKQERLKQPVQSVFTVQYHVELVKITDVSGNLTASFSRVEMTEKILLDILHRNMTGRQSVSYRWL